MSDQLRALGIELLEGFGAEQMALMRPRSLFLNLSRGIAVDTLALREHIESGHIAGAAVDVFPIEPKRQGDPFESDLRGLKNVILTPHVGGSTEEAQQDIGRFVASKLRSYASFGGTSLSVNMPEINLPADATKHRLAHVHENHPGVLARINGLLGEHGVNIEAQSLATRGDIGRALVEGRGAEAARCLEAWLALFGDRFYIELQRVGRSDEEAYIGAAAALVELPKVGYDALFGTGRLHGLYCRYNVSNRSCDLAGGLAAHLPGAVGGFFHV